MASLSEYILLILGHYWRGLVELADLRNTDVEGLNPGI